MRDKKLHQAQDPWSRDPLLQSLLIGAMNIEIGAPAARGSKNHYPCIEQKNVHVTTKEKQNNEVKMKLKTKIEE